MAHQGGVVHGHPNKRGRSSLQYSGPFVGKRRVSWGEPRPRSFTWHEQLEEHKQRFALPLQQVDGMVPGKMMSTSSMGELIGELHFHGPVGG